MTDTTGKHQIKAIYLIEDNTLQNTRPTIVVVEIVVKGRLGKRTVEASATRLMAT